MAGEIILQKSFTKNSKDTLEEFTAKIREIEYEILPLSIIKLLTRSFKMHTLQIGKYTLGSRLIVGSGKYRFV